MAEVEFAEATQTAEAAVALDGATEPWHGEGYGELVTAKGWTGADDVLKGYSELEKFKGVASGEHIVLPKSVDDVEGWGKLFNAVGRPETADGYKFDNQTGIELGDELMSGFKAFAHKAGYTQNQLEGAINFQLDAIKASNEIFDKQQADTKAENIALMQQKWQTDYEPTKTKIDAMSEKLGVKEFFESLGIDTDPRVVNMLLTVANSDSESLLNEGGDDAPIPKDLNEQMEEIKKNPALMDKFHQDHNKVYAEFMELNQKIANAGQGRAPQ